LGRARAAVGPEGLVVVTGSLYLVGALRRPHPEGNIYEH
jgi:folylpolyglutamate synthase/dihydropteroate synthase